MRGVPQYVPRRDGVSISCADLILVFPVGHPSAPVVTFAWRRAWPLSFSPGMRRFLPPDVGNVLEYVLMSAATVFRRPALGTVRAIRHPGRAEPRPFHLRTLPHSAMPFACGGCGVVLEGCTSAGVSTGKRPQHRVESVQQSCLVGVAQGELTLAACNHEAAINTGGSLGRGGVLPLKNRSGSPRMRPAFQTSGGARVLPCPSQRHGARRMRGMAPRVRYRRGRFLQVPGGSSSSGMGAEACAAWRFLGHSGALWAWRWSRSTRARAIL